MKNLLRDDLPEPPLWIPLGLVRRNINASACSGGVGSCKKMRLTVAEEIESRRLDYLAGNHPCMGFQYICFATNIFLRYFLG